MTITVLVCGGRHFGSQFSRTTFEFVPEPLSRMAMHFELNNLHFLYGFSLLIHGAASGADTLAGMWARDEGIPVQEYHAEWKRLGRGAGMVRNRRMLVEGKPDLVVAFKGDAGTKGMIDIARQAGVEVLTPGWEYGK